MGKRLARGGIHALCVSLQGFLNQGSTNATIGSGDQDRFAFDIHILFLFLPAVVGICSTVSIELTVRGDFYSLAATIPAAS
jgi:hypothetical protein